jgi:hypothetical protein
MFTYVLEIYVVWHPDDHEGQDILHEFIEHFHGSSYTGLLGGAIEVFGRSRGAGHAMDAPRPIPLPCKACDGGVEPAHYVAFVPVLGNGLALATRSAEAPWRRYLQTLADTVAATPARCQAFPVYLKAAPSSRTVLEPLFPNKQPIGAANPLHPPTSLQAMRCRDLAQSLAQWIGPTPQQSIRVFISHTKRTAHVDEGVGPLVDAVRSVIANTRLESFFDAQNLPPGADWDKALRENAASSALLALRTDLYATRDWCQREILIAKNAGAPLTMLDALDRGESRGSFLMDHVPRVPTRRTATGATRADVEHALDLLVDKCLERALWLAQREIATENPALDIDWWAPQAPEPATLIEWLTTRSTGNDADTSRETLTVLHPDPPLGEEEKATLAKIVRAVKPHQTLDLLTPRSLGARFDPTRPAMSPLLPPQALRGKRLALSVSESADLTRLGFVEDHFRLALAEIARVVLVSGGSIAYGGHLRHDGYTVFLVGEQEKYSPVERPMQVCLAWTEHREMTDKAWDDAMMSMGTAAEAIFLDIDGQPVPRGKGTAPADETNLPARALTAMRRYMAAQYDGRVLLGGKQHGFKGEMPGIMEEAILTVQAAKPLYLAGGFGGATLALAQCLDERCAAFCPVDTEAPADDPRTLTALKVFASMANDNGWSLLRNGLTPDENLRLAVTHRPGEIAELVCLGLGRLGMGGG